MLPDLRNLGTILRVLFAVNGAALVVAFAREPRANALVDEWIALASYVEPYLLAELAVLATLAPRLVRLPYKYGVAAIVVVTVAVGIALHYAMARLFPLGAGSLARELAYALAATAALLYYFQLRIKALSPAIAEARLQPLLENAVYHGVEPASTPGIVSINLFLSRGEVHAILKNPIPANGRRHQTGNRMALDNVRERLALHFDAEASLESRVARDVYEVHIRMPYRTVMSAAAAPAGATANAQRDRGGAAQRAHAPAPTSMLRGMPQPGVARG